MMIAVMAAIMRVIMTESLTYKEIADRLNIKLTSARRIAMRKKWQRIKGNDGETRVLVPIEVLERRNDSPNDDHNDSHNDQHNDSQIKELQAKVEGLQELLSSERRRADAAEQDRDRWHEQAIKPWWKGSQDNEKTHLL